MADDDNKTAPMGDDRSIDNPAFTGLYETDLTLTLMGVTAVRKLRIDYEYWPSWEYYDLAHEQLRTSLEGFTLDFKLLTHPPEELEDEEPEWVTVDDLQEVGVLSQAMWQPLLAEIDEMARAEDKQRRKNARKGRRKKAPAPANQNDEPIDEAILRVMAKADLPPEFAYAYKKTGLLGLDADKSAWPKESIAEWNDAVDEYRAIQRAAADPDRADGRTTLIPELLAAPFTKADLVKVQECVRAIAPIERSGMSLSSRIEFAAAVLSTVCESGYAAAERADGCGAGATGYSVTEELILQRAREIYAQGHA